MCVCINEMMMEEDKIEEAMTVYICVCLCVIGPGEGGRRSLLLVAVCMKAQGIQQSVSLCVSVCDCVIVSDCI
jgi:hypothetical protein